MADDHPGDIVDKLKRSGVLRQFTKNRISPQCYDQVVAWITRQYELAAYLRAVEFCLASTKSIQGDNPLSRFVLIDSQLDESSRGDCLTVTTIVCPLGVTLFTINTTVIGDEIDNELEYIKTKPLTLKPTSTIRVQQELNNGEPTGCDVQDSSEEESGGDELKDTEEEEEEEDEEEEGKEELLGMLEDYLGPGILLIASTVRPRNPTIHTVKLEDNDFRIHNAKESGEVDADFNNIALTDLEGEGDLYVLAQREDQADNANVECWVSVILRAVELLSVLSCCHSYCQSCCPSSAADRTNARVVVRAQPLSELLPELRSEISHSPSYCPRCCQSSAAVSWSHNHCPICCQSSATARIFHWSWCLLTG